MVVSIEELDCLDLLIWLQTGAEAASRLSSSQPRISRIVQKVSGLFGVDISKENGEWGINGDIALLNLERRGHQEYRWRMGRALRIDAQCHSGLLFCDSVPDEWIAGNFDYLENFSPLQHLCNSVIDAWIACYPDVPDEEDEDFACFHLSRLPLCLVVGEGHPLLRFGDQITFEMVKEYPSLLLPAGAYPKLQIGLQKLGLWNLPQDVRHFPQVRSKARFPSDLIVGITTAFAIHLFSRPQVILPISIPLEVGDTLVVRREYADHPALLSLLDQLRSRVTMLRQKYPELTILGS